MDLFHQVQCTPEVAHTVHKLYDGLQNRFSSTDLAYPHALHGLVAKVATAILSGSWPQFRRYGK